MQTKPKYEREHDMMEPNAGPPSKEPQIFECLFLFANKDKVTLVILATRGCPPLSKRKGQVCVSSQIEKLVITP